LPYYVVRERGFSTAEMASLTGIAWVVSALASIIAGWVIDRYVRAGHANFAYKSVMVAAHVGTVGCMLCIGFGGQAWALAGIFIYQLLTGAASSGVYAIPQILAGLGPLGRNPECLWHVRGRDRTCGHGSPRRGDRSLRRGLCQRRTGQYCRPRGLGVDGSEARTAHVGQARRTR